MSWSKDQEINRSENKIQDLFFWLYTINDGRGGCVYFYVAYGGCGDRPLLQVQQRE